MVIKECVMNAWDIDPNFHLPVLRAIWQALRLSLRKRLPERAAEAAPCAGCRG
jgi:hypothetical protein